MWFIVKLVSIFLSIDGINSQKDDNIGGVGGTKDEIVIFRQDINGVISK